MTTATNTTSLYGFMELRHLYQKYAMWALSIAAGLHLAALGGYFLGKYLLEDDEPIYSARVVLKYSDLGPPPSMTNTTAAPSVSVEGPSAKPTVGTPVPVPDAEISPEATIATQTELAQQVGPGVETGEGTGGAVIENDLKIDDGPPPDFVPVEKQPTAIKAPPPLYPEIARRAGVEGTVWVKIWVDKEGKAKKAQIIRSDAELFNQAALDAAMQWSFTPAVMNNGPVAVWVSIPFKFKLNQTR